MYLTELAWQTPRPSPAPWQEVGARQDLEVGESGAWCQENPHLRASPPRRVQGVGRGGSGENLRGFPAGAAGGGAGEGGGLVCRVRAGSSASDRVTHVQTRARVSAGPLSVCGTGERAGTRVLLTRPTRRPLHPCHGQGHRGQGDELPHPARKQ